jgi:hypothetical protein
MSKSIDFDAARITAAFKLSGTITRGTPPNHANAR